MGSRTRQEDRLFMDGPVHTEVTLADRQGTAYPAALIVKADDSYVIRYGGFGTVWYIAGFTTVRADKHGVITEVKSSAALDVPPRVGAKLQDHLTGDWPHPV